MESTYESIILGVISNALTSILAYIGSLGHRAIIGEDFLKKLEQRKTSIEPILEAIMENISEDIDWENAEVILFLKSPEVESIVRQFFATKLSTDSEDGQYLEKIRNEFSTLLNLHLGWSKDRQSKSSLMLFDTILSESERCLDLAINEGLLSAHEAKSSYRYHRLMDEISALSKNLDFLTSDRNVNINEVLDFEKKYREQIAFHFRNISPPDLDSQKKWPIDALYVSPNFEYSNPEQEDKKTELSLSGFRNRIYRTVLLGDPGSGKSTFTIKLAHDISSQYSKRLLAGRQITPIHLILRDYGALKKSQSCSILQFIEITAVSKHQLPTSPNGSFEYLLRNGRALVIFDGLDELLDTSYRQDISADIESFCKLYPAVPVIVTSRKVGYEQAPLDPKQFDVFYLATFNDHQTQAYVEKWFNLDVNLTQDQRDEKITSFMQESEAVPDLRSNALLLALMCNIYRGEGYIPKNRPDVYEKCATMLFERWDKSRGIHSILPFEAHVRPAMMYIAHWIYIDESRQSGVTEDQLIEPTANYLHQRQFDDRDQAIYAARSFIEFCRGRAWVFTDTGTTRKGNQLYQFTHRTFLEYFTAAYIVRIYRTPSELFDYLLPRIEAREWDVVAQLAFQLQNKRFEEAGDELLYLLLNSLTQDHKRHNILDFAVRCLEFMVPSPKVKTAITNKVISEAISWGAEKTKAVNNVVNDVQDQPRDMEGISLMANITSVAAENRDIVSQTVYQQFSEILQDNNDENMVYATLEIGINFSQFHIFFQGTGVNRENHEYWDQICSQIYKENLGLIKQIATVYPTLGINCLWQEDINIEDYVSYYGADSIFDSVFSPILPWNYIYPASAIARRAYQIYEDNKEYPLPQKDLEFLGNLLLEMETPWKTFDGQRYESIFDIKRSKEELTNLSPDALFFLLIVEAAYLETSEKRKKTNDWLEKVHQSYVSKFDLFLPTLFARFIPTPSDIIEQQLTEFGFSENQKASIWRWIEGNDLVKVSEEDDDIPF